MHIRLYKNFLTSEFCDKLIEKFNTQKQEHTKHDAADFYEVDIVKNDWPEVPWLVTKFQELVDVYTTSLRLQPEKQWPINREWEHYRIKKYNKGKQQFNLHTDNAADRILAFFVYLNDVEEGGETSFPIHQASITPVKGAALVFPTTWEYLHEGKTPLSNDKYILGGYLRGKNAN